MDPRLDKLAQVLVHYSTEVKPGDLVMIHPYDPVAEPLALAVYRQVLEAGGYGIFRMQPSGTTELLIKHAHDKQLDRTNPVNLWMMENIDVRIALRAFVNTKALTNTDPKRVSRMSKAEEPINQALFERHARGELRWVVSQFPTHASAQDAEMSLREYEDFVYGGGMLHLDDPVKYWRNKFEEQERLIQWLHGKEQVTVKGENIDLNLSIKDRTFVNSAGKRNFPDGEIFTGPVEESVDGWVKFTYPAVRNDREIEDVELMFEAGKVVKSTASKGLDFLNAYLDTDTGARYLGEFAIGTNENIQTFTRNTLFDEKIGGTVHMALGNGYPNTGSKNRSAIHWDMICDMRSGGEIHVDGELFYENGEFRI